MKTEDAVQDGLRQLQGYRKPVCIAGTNKATIRKALENTEGTNVGVIDNQGNILRLSKRKKELQSKCLINSQQYLIYFAVQIFSLADSIGCSLIKGKV